MIVTPAISGQCWEERPKYSSEADTILMQLKTNVDHFHLPGERVALKICFESESFPVKNGVLRSLKKRTDYDYEDEG